MVQEIHNRQRRLAQWTRCAGVWARSGSFTGVRIGIVALPQGLAGVRERKYLPMIRCFDTHATVMAQGAWRKTGATRVLAAIDARMGEVYWAEYQRDARASGRAKRRKRCETGTGRRAVETAFRRWATVERVGRVARSGEGVRPDAVMREVSLPAAEDMLPSPVKALAAGGPLRGHAEPVYLRNEVAWKKLPARMTLTTITPHTLCCELE